MAYLTNGQTFTGSYATVNFNQVGTDTNNAITTGASWHWTCPVSAVYMILVVIADQYNTSHSIGVQILKNGSVISGPFSIPYIPGQGAYAGLSCFTNLNLGDTISIQTLQSGGSFTTMSSSTVITIVQNGGTLGGNRTNLQGGFLN